MLACKKLLQGRGWAVVVVLSFPMGVAHLSPSPAAGLGWLDRLWLPLLPGPPKLLILTSMSSENSCWHHATVALTCFILQARGDPATVPVATGGSAAARDRCYRRLPSHTSLDTYSDPGILLRHPSDPEPAGLPSNLHSVRTCAGAAGDARGLEDGQGQVRGWGPGLRWLEGGAVSVDVAWAFMPAVATIVGIQVGRRCARPGSL